MMFRCVVHIGQVGLTGVLSTLNHILFGNRGYQTFSWIDELALTQNQVPVYELVKCGFLAGVFTVAEPFFNEFARFLQGFSTFVSGR